MLAPPSLGLQAVLLGLSFCKQCLVLRASKTVVNNKPFAAATPPTHCSIRLSVSTSNLSVEFWVSQFAWSVWSWKHSTLLSTVFDRCVRRRKKCFAWVKLSQKRVSKRQHTFERQAPHGFRRVDPTNFAFQDVFEEREFRTVTVTKKPLTNSGKRRTTPNRCRIEICVFETVSLKLAEEQRWEPMGGSEVWTENESSAYFPRKTKPSCLSCSRGSKNEPRTYKCSLPVIRKFETWDQ